MPTSDQSVPRTVLEAVVTIAEAAHVASDPHVLAQAVVDALVFTHGAAAAAMYAQSAEPAYLELLHAVGLPDSTAEAARLLPVERGLAGAAVTRRDVVSAGDIGGNERLPAEDRQPFSDGGATVVAVPLLYRERVLGCLIAAWSVARPLPPAEREAYRAIGRMAGLALANAEQFAQLRIALVELKAARERLQLILDTIPVRVFWKDNQSRYLGCNAHFARDAGLGSPDEIVGLTDKSLPWRDQAEVIQAIDREVLRMGRPKLNYQLLLSRPDGSERWENVSKIPLRDENGQVFGVLACYEDITERKRAADGTQGPPR
ncbi:MAG: PAS domain-containing protein [Gemmatimonadales bacterium]